MNAKWRQRLQLCAPYLAAGVLATSAGALAWNPYPAIGTVLWIDEHVFEAALSLKGAGAFVVAVAAAQAAMAAWLVARPWSLVARWGTIGGMLVLSAPFVYLAGWGQGAGCGCLGGLNLFADAQLNAAAGLTKCSVVAVALVLAASPGRPAATRAKRVPKHS